MMNRRIITLAFLIFSVQFVFGQTLNNKFSISPKLGVYAGVGANSTSGTIAGLEFSTTIKEVELSVDFYKFNELDFFGQKPNESYNQLGIMLGRFFDTENQFLRLEFQGGLAPTWGTQRTQFARIDDSNFFKPEIFDTEQFFTVGLVGKLGFNILPLDNLGIGFDIQANLNPKNPMFMFMVSMDIGQLK